MKIFIVTINGKDNIESMDISNYLFDKIHGNYSLNVSEISTSEIDRTHLCGEGMKGEIINDKPVISKK